MINNDIVNKQTVLEQTYNWDKDEFLWLIKSPDYFKKIPTASQSKIGRWIIKDGREQGYDIAGIKTWYIQIMCDKCGFIKTAIEGRTEQYKFCPNCGQPKMQEVEE